MAAKSKKAREPHRLAVNEMIRDCLATRVRLLDRKLTRIYDAALRAQGLTAAQLNLLVAIQALKPARSREVAALLSMEISTLSRNASLMEERGWIKVDRVTSGNGRVLSLTSTGASKLREAKPAWRKAQREATTTLGAEDAAVLKRLVDRLWLEQLH
jgi:DNA-binding MarR family transcriptional regulator